MYIIYTLEIVVLLYLAYGLNVFLHGVGIFLMVKVQRHNRRRTNQDILLINLALGDFLKNVVSIVGLVTYSRLHAGVDLVFWSEVWKVLVSINGFGLYLWQYIALIFVSLDRLLTVLYRPYTELWTRKKTKFLIATCWSLELICCMAPYLAHKLNGFSNRDFIDIYVKVGLDVIFIILSIAAYSAMFCKFVRSHRRTVRVSQVSQYNTQQPQTPWELFRRSRFVVAVFLITSFFLCVSIPDMALSSLSFLRRPVPDVLFKIFLFLSAASDTIDALVYVFLRAEVRKLLMKMMKFDCLSERHGLSVATVSDYRRRRRAESQSSRTRSFTFNQ